MTPSYDDLLSWYRADRPMALSTWLAQPAETRDSYVAAATQAAIERYTLAVSVLADVGRTWAPIDGGRLEDRARVAEAMRQAAQREWPPT